MKKTLTGLLLVLAHIIAAQKFTDISHLSTLVEARYGSVGFADVDGDGDLDLLITGANQSSDRVTKLYDNDGTGNFSVVPNTPFEEVERSSLAFADVDGDGDEDVLITGSNGIFSDIAKLYLNDGAGHFTEDTTGTPFEGVDSGAIAFADVDGDKDEDLLITGRSNSIGVNSNLYINDGAGNFKEDTTSTIAGAYSASVATADVDGDQDTDVLISGIGAGSSKISKLYINDGTGRFAESSGTPFDAIADGSVAFADVDGDNDSDVLITGEDTDYNTIAKLYTNDGNGKFTEVPNVPFPGVEFSAIAISDVDNDNDEDVLITGRTFSHAIVARLYINDGAGNFSLVSGTPFQGVDSGVLAFADVDGDNDSDVLITGVNSSFITTTNLYRNDGSGVFLKEWPQSSKDKLKFRIYPNPIKDRLLKLEYHSINSGSVSVKLYNMKGTLIDKLHKKMNVGEQVMSIDMTCFPEGQYIIELKNGKHQGSASFLLE